MQKKQYGSKKLYSSMTLEEKESKFINEVYAVALDNYDSELIDDFCFYWCEPNRSKTKLRFEGQKFFDINRRLRTWYRNKTNWSKSKEIIVKSETVSSKMKSYD